MTLTKGQTMANEEREVEAAIAAYRAELVANATLGEAEVAELEDHLRELIDELRGAGAVTAAVLAAARRRIGEPREVAAELARIRTAFGARLSRGRAWSAAAILLAITGWTAWSFLPVTGLVSRTGAEVGLGLILILGLVARRTWPRAILLGHAAITTASCAIWIQFFAVDGPVMIATLVGYAGVVALIMPWRRGELTGASWALAAWAVAYVGASYALFELRGSTRFASPIPLTAIVVDQVLPVAALVGVALAALGTVLRARWGVILGLATAVGLAAVAIAVLTLDPSGRFAAHHATASVMVILGAVAGIAAPLLAWSSTRRGAGELRSLVSA